MGRKAEPGIAFYRVNCDHVRNKKVRLLFNEFGSDGYWVWQCLLSAIYEGKGYYFNFKDKEALELFATDVCKKRVSLVEEIVAGCIRRSLFDQRVFDVFGVLTSDMIQEVYLDATAERRRKGTQVEIIENYFLLKQDESKRWESVVFVTEKNILPGKNGILPRNNSNNPRKNPQSKVEKSKEEEIHEPAGSPAGTPAVDTQLSKDLEKEYKSVAKDKTSIYNFIKQHSPRFIDPYKDFWNAFATEFNLPEVSVINEKRKKKFSVRIKERAFNLPNILRAAKESEFLLTSGWFGFDWILENDTNYLKIMEGNYKAVKKDEKINHEANDEYLKKRQAAEQRTRELSQS